MKSFSLCGFVISFFVVCMFISCQQVQEIPFPEELTEYPQPQTFPLEFTDPKPLHWDTTGKKIITPTVFSLDFKKLKGKQYDSAGFKPLPFAVTQSPFNFSALPVRALDPGSMTKHPLKIKTEPLPQPASSIKFQRPERVSAATTDLKVWQQVGQLNILIYGMAKDPSGLIWLAAHNGVYRFDGTRLTNMIPGVFCKDLCFDNNGTLWYVDATDKQQSAIVKADFANATIIKYFTDLAVTSIINMAVGNDGNIWIAGSPSSPPALICPEKMGYFVFTSEAGFNSSKYLKLTIDDGNRVWTGSRNGIDIIDHNANKVIHIGRENGLSSDSIDAFTTGPDGRMWAAWPNGVDAIDIKSGKITHYRISDDRDQRTYSLLFDKAGQLWIGRRKGLSIINFNNNTLRQIGNAGGITYDDNINSLLEYKAGQFLITGFSNTLGSSIIYTIGQSGKTVFPFGDISILSSTEDSKGNVWVGTENELFVVDSTRKTYWRVDTDNGLANPFIESVSEQNGKIVITTNGGYNIYNPSKNEWTRVSRKEGLQTDSVYSLTEDQKGNTWITGTSDGIFRYDHSTGYILNVYSKGGLNGNSVAQASVFPEDNNIWMVTNQSGLNIIDPENNTIRFIKNIPGMDVFSSKGITIDSRHRIWITGATDYGLYMIDPAGKKVTRFTTEEGLSGNSTSSVLEYKGKMLLCTYQKVHIITPPELSSRHRWEIDLLAHSEGFKKNAKNFVSDAISKRDDYLWGDNGLGVIYGIRSDTSSGTDYVTGIRIMGKSTVFTNQEKAQVPDTAQEKNSISLSSSGYTEKGSLKWDSLSGPYQLPVNLSLPNDQNTIQFSFTEAGAGRPDSLEFAYILEGIDKKWVVTKDLQTDTYLNLSPGNYIFKVASRWQNGKWNTPATFSFTIRPPWYNTWLAYLVYFIAAVSLLRLYIIFRSRKLMRANKLLEEKVKHRTNQLQESLESLKSTQAQLIQSEKMASLGELAAGIAHEIQNPLNFVNNFSEINSELITELTDKVDQGDYDEVKIIARDIKENSEKISHHGKRADGIVKGMLQHSRNSGGLKEPTNINVLCDEYLRLAYHGLRAKDKSFNSGMSTDFDDSIPLLNIVPQDMGRVILNLLTNAFYAVNEKVKSEGKDYKPLVSISTKKADNKVEITISDNGNGIPQSIIDKIFQPFFTTKPTGHGTGLGLSMSYDIVTKAHGGELKVESKEGEGTRFYISLPLKNN